MGLELALEALDDYRCVLSVRLELELGELCLLKKFVLGIKISLESLDFKLGISFFPNGPFQIAFKVSDPLFEIVKLFVLRRSV